MYYDQLLLPDNLPIFLHDGIKTFICLISYTQYSSEGSGFAGTRLIGLTGSSNDFQWEKTTTWAAGFSAGSGLT